MHTCSDDIGPVVIASTHGATEGSQEGVWHPFAGIGSGVRIQRVCGVESVFENHVLNTLGQRNNIHLAVTQLRHFQRGHCICACAAFAATCDVVNARDVFASGAQCGAVLFFKCQCVGVSGCNEGGCCRI